MAADEASSSCLEAGVSYHPVLRRCSWEAPDNTVRECVRQTWVAKHRWVLRALRPGLERSPGEL